MSTDKTEQALPPLPAYGAIKWDDLIGAVCEAQTGNREVGWEKDPTYYIGHQPVSINMNSLNRIVSAFVERAALTAAPPAQPQSEPPKPVARVSGVHANFAAVDWLPNARRLRVGDYVYASQPTERAALEEGRNVRVEGP